MSYQPKPGGQPPSFKTNVNRAKTKRWVEAKSYTYDGDDWGDADEYDEYGGYDEPPPPTKPTGLRQQGQSAHSIPQNPYASPTGPYQSPVGNGNSGYGNMSGPQQLGLRSATNPQPRVDTGLVRNNSFDRGDEKRAFSAGGLQQGVVSPREAPRQQQSYQPEQTYEAANIQAPMQFDPNQMRPVQPKPHAQSERSHPDQPQATDSAYAPPADYRENSYSQDSRLPSMGSRTQSMTSNSSSLDIHNRRDFTPSALPQPLHTRGSPSPDSRPMSQHPPRKSSLSQANQPQMTPPGRMSNVPASSESESVHRERTSSNAEKPLPFVRPADIYRRMQEMERERQSQESSRPSMDAITGSVGQFEEGDHAVLGEEEPDPSHPATKPAPTQTHDIFEAKEQNRPRQTTLDPVAERKSEYALDGNIGDHQTASNQAHDLGLANSDTTEGVTQAAPRTVVHNTLSPVLPEVARMSAFGDSFLNTRDVTEQASSRAQFAPLDGNPLTDQDRTSNESSSGLQHQPSSGFRSVVHQAFDRTDDQIPPTPTSTAGSSVQRSTSRGTSVVSPIISRDPSTTTPKGTSDMRPMTPTYETDDASPRPQSSDSAGTQRQFTRRPSPTRAMAPEIGDQSPPATFIPGHRRDLSTPSPGNSPARTPALEVNKQLHRPHEAEVAMSTPTELAFDSTSLNQEKAPLDNTDAPLVDSPVDNSRKRSESPSKGRVRDLAGKFESTSNSRRGSDQSLSQRGGSGRTSPQRVDLPISTRPLADRMESFRPHLPGGWDSYTSNAPPTTATDTIIKNDASGAIQQPAPSTTDISSAEEAQRPIKFGTPKIPEQSMARSLQEDASPNDPFSSVAAKSSAMACAIVADNTTGNSPELAVVPKDFEREEPPQHESSVDRDSSERERSVLVSTGSQAEASQSDDDEPVQKLQKSQELGTPSDHIDSPKLSKVLSDRSEQNTPHAPLLAPLSLRTDTGSTYESDRLRREIEKSLTPNMPSEPTTAESDSPFQGERRIPVDATMDRHGVAHESMVIPREYDSYWNGSESLSSSRASSERIQTLVPSHAGPQRGEDQAPAPPLMDKNSQVLAEERQSPLPDTRPTIPQHRFSWERTSLNEEAPSDAGQETIAPTIEPKQLSNIQGLPHLDPRLEHEVGSEGHTGLPSSVPDPVPEPSLYEGGLEISEHQAEKYHIADPTHVSGLSGISRATEHPLPDRSQQVREEEPVTTQSDAPSNLEVRPGLPPPPPHPSAQPKTPAFREILALKTPADRIRGYNEARDLWAKQDTGLAHWLAVTTTELPEHADVLANVGRRPAALMGHKPSSSRLLSGFRSTGPQSDVSENSSSAFGQGSIPSSGSNKLSSQQVQAKGKDLLHTAGVFGGKANVAAKGLFSKGRSKLRGAGGSDKDLTPPSSPDPAKRGIQIANEPPQKTMKNMEPARSSLPQPQSWQNSYLSSFDDAEPLREGDAQDLGQDQSASSFRVGSTEQPRLFSNEQDDVRGPRNNSLPSEDARRSDSIHLDAPEDTSSEFDSSLVASGTRTPTQADFNESQQTLLSSPQNRELASVQQRLAHQANSLRDAIGHSVSDDRTLLKTLPMPQSRYSSNSNNTLDTAKDDETNTRASESRLSEDSNVTFHTAHTDNNSRPNSKRTWQGLDLKIPDADQTVKKSPDGTPTQLSLPEPPRQSYSDVSNFSYDRTMPGHIPMVNPELSQPQVKLEPASYSLPTFREPSIDSVPDRHHSDLPPSPVSPQHSLTPETVNHQTRREPVYYGPEHNFGAAGPNDRPLQRPRSRSRSSQDPDLQDHPALRPHSPPVQSSTIPSASRLPRERPSQPSESHQDPHDSSAKGAAPGAPNQDPLGENPKRNSGFFKSFKSPMTGTQHAERDQSFVTPSRSSTDVPKKSKRNSLFRSRNGEKANDSGQSEEGSPAPSSHVESIRRNASRDPELAGIDSQATSSSSKFRNKLQRASTSSNTTNDSGKKKKRFSAIGSLFGTRSRQADPSPTARSRQPQQVTYYQFGPPEESQQQQQQQQAHSSRHTPSFQPPTRQSSSVQVQQQSVPESMQTPSRPGNAGYYAPGQSEQKAPPSSTPTWLHTAERVSQPRQSSVKEPPAYAQDRAMRESAAASMMSTPAAAAHSNTVQDSHSRKSRSSIFSRSKDREAPLSPPHGRNASLNLWKPSSDQNRQSTQSRSKSRHSQPAFSSPSSTTPSQSNQARVLTYSQFGDSHISYPSMQQSKAKPQGSSHQTVPGQQQQQQQPPNVVTFNQFPPNEPRRENSPPPPPPPPKDDWHITRPRARQTNSFAAPHASNNNNPPTQQLPRNTQSMYNPQPTNYASQSQPPAFTQQQRAGAGAVPLVAPSHHQQQPKSSYNIATTTGPSSPPPPPPPSSQSHPPASSSQAEQRQRLLPPLYTETTAAAAEKIHQPPLLPSSAPSSAFVSGKNNTSTESKRKARQRELEMMGGSGSNATTPVVAGAALPQQRQKQEEDEPPIVMSSSSYPGMEWTPERWEED